VLASSSPRRRELLEKNGFDFKIVNPRARESSKNLDPGKRVVCNAKAKVLSIQHKFPDSVIISADTLVYLEGMFFGKPTNHNDAINILEMLSGKKHQVFTGIAVLNTSNGNIYSGYEETHVYFKDLNSDTIRNYVISSRSMDKAGAYAIQNEENFLIEKFEGSYTNVVGLPIELLFSLLDKIIKSNSNNDKALYEI
jgi:septum formation protein